MNNYDTFVNNLTELVEEEELTINVRDLTSGTHQYRYRKVVALVSVDLETYAETLLIRFGRGQLHPKPYSIKVVAELPLIPEK